jgi:hypothetical protein
MPGNTSFHHFSCIAMQQKAGDTIVGIAGIQEPSYDMLVITEVTINDESANPCINYFIPL